LGATVIAVSRHEKAQNKRKKDDSLGSGGKGRGRNETHLGPLGTRGKLKGESVQGGLKKSGVPRGNGGLDRRTKVGPTPLAAWSRENRGRRAEKKLQMAGS